MIAGVTAIVIVKKQLHRVRLDKYSDKEIVDREEEAFILIMQLLCSTMASSTGQHGILLLFHIHPYRTYVVSIPGGGESIYIVIKRKPIEDRPIMCILPIIVFFYLKQQHFIE